MNLCGFVDDINGVACGGVASSFETVKVDGQKYTVALCAKHKPSSNSDV